MSDEAQLDDVDPSEAARASDVGYGKPPFSSRFRKGKSGNPKGRPRGRKGALPYEAVLGRKVTIREGNRDRRVSAEEAFLLHLAKSGLEGDGGTARAAMHAIEAEPGSLLFIEEPEQSIHPRRLGEIVELLRQVVAERKCQVVVVTHSPVLLDAFRDEPEAILLFRRGDTGTRVRSLTEIPALVDALKDAEPGEMLAQGFFEANF